MPPPVLSDWEYYYNGLTFGGSQTFGVTRVVGLFPPPTIKSDVLQKPGADGAWVYAKNFEERHIVFEGDMGITPVEVQMATWRTTFAPQANPLPLSFKRPGITQKKVNCVPLRTHYDEDTLYSIGYVLWVVELVAEDPTHYEDV